MPEPGDAPPSLTADEQLVADEIAAMRAGKPDTMRTLRADLLEQATTATAAVFLRENALRALAAMYAGRHDEWVVTAALQHQVFKEQRLKDRLARQGVDLKGSTYLPQMPESRPREFYAETDDDD